MSQRCSRTQTMWALAFCACLAPGSAFAHMPVSTGAFEGGFTHPLLSFEHALALVAVGLWAGQLQGRARSLVPLSFIFALWLGVFLNVRLVALPAVDIINYVSLIVFGGLVAMRLPLKWIDWRAASLVTLAFGIFHGYANADAMPLAWTASSFAAGLVVSAIILLSVSAFLSIKCSAHFPLVIASRVAGSWIAATGMLMLAFSYTQGQ